MKVIVPRWKNGNPNGHYHTRECRNVPKPENRREITIERAHRLGCEECKFCNGTAKMDRSDRSTSLRTLVNQGKV